MGVHFMRTDVGFVEVAFELYGVKKRKKVTIIDAEGNLMDSRLRSALMGTGIRIGNENLMDVSGAKFIGAIWKPPYELLAQLLLDRVSKQKELRLLLEHEGTLGRSGSDSIVDEPEIEVPDKAENADVTAMVLSELALRRRLKRRIKHALGRTANSARPVSGDGIIVASADGVIATNDNSGPNYDPVPRPYTGFDD